MGIQQRVSYNVKALVLDWYIYNKGFRILLKCAKGRGLRDIQQSRADQSPSKGGQE